MAADGNVRKSGDVVGGPGKSYLFFLTAHYLGIELIGDKVVE